MKQKETDRLEGSWQN